MFKKFIISQLLLVLTFNIYSQTNKPILHGKHWIAITGKPIGATAGSIIFEKGGNAVDAACAMVAATATMWDVLGWGGETQALIYHPKLKKVIGINALGVAPSGATPEYYREKGIPIAPTFVIKNDRNVRRLIDKVEEHGWKSFVLKPHYAYANIGIGKFDVDEPDVKGKVAKYLTKHKRFPGFVCQQVMDGFAKFWEILEIRKSW